MKKLLLELRSTIEDCKKNGLSSKSYEAILSKVEKMDLEELPEGQVYKVRSAGYNNASYKGDHVNDCALRIEQDSKLILTVKIFQIKNGRPLTNEEEDLWGMLVSVKGFYLYHCEICEEEFISMPDQEDKRDKHICPPCCLYLKNELLMSEDDGDFED